MGQSQPGWSSIGIFLGAVSQTFSQLQALQSTDPPLPQGWGLKHFPNP